MVDNASLVEWQSAVIVPCPVWTINDGSLVAGIFHFVGSQYGRRFFLIGTVEVAGDDGRQVLCHFLHLGKDELDAFLACCLTVVVEVGVEVYHLLAVFFVFQYRPSTNTVVRSVPALLAKLLRCLVQGKVAMFYHAEFMLVIEDRAVLALMFSVVASYTDALIYAIESCLEVCHLVGAYFLHTQEIGLIIGEHLCHLAFTVVPTVFVVYRCVQTYVE